MILDKIENAHLYYGLGEKIAAALRFFEEYCKSPISITEKLSLDGDSLYIVNAEYITASKKETGLLERHEKYIDIMLLLDGQEIAYYAPAKDCDDHTTYCSERDFAMVKMSADTTPLNFYVGQFAVFMPQDAHMAGEIMNEPCKVHKLIAKVEISD